MRRKVLVLGETGAMGRYPVPEILKMKEGQTKKNEYDGIVVNVNEKVDRPYYYLEYLLTELPPLVDRDGKISDPGKPDQMLPWSKTLPEKCYKPRRS